MDIALAFAMGQAHRNDPLMVFDWDKAAHILAVRNPDEALAGLQDDYEYTAGAIWRKGMPVRNEYTYLASTWAHPMLIIGDEEIECWRYESEVPEWNSDTKWPESEKVDVSNMRHLWPLDEAPATRFHKEAVTKDSDIQAALDILRMAMR